MKNYALILFGLAVALLQGCQSTAVASEGATPGIRISDAKAPNATIHMDSVNIIDKSLQSSDRFGRHYVGKIAIEKVGARRTPTGNVEVLTVIRNRTDFPLQIEARVQFYDKNEFPVGSPSAWQRVYLPALSVANYTEKSLSGRNVGHYYIEIREGR